MMPFDNPTTIVQKARGINHTYEFIGSRPYINRHGYETRVLSWLGHCRICGQPFIVTSSAGVPRELARTCQEHRRMVK